MEGTSCKSKCSKLDQNVWLREYVFWHLRYNVKNSCKSCISISYAIKAGEIIESNIMGITTTVYKPELNDISDLLQVFSRNII